ncbi:type IA DNA topoisomerase [Ammoniphilus sp. CFH 90114]|uniref:type IA DNA topoisomerase n=1 Tax=Ammoniphilus sp. CFH 90114 TaxID=2493665 RepID=UPI00100FCE91|nr:type IA DNA topoisomerase [Ammoniphilus sp. CFH 90114]RXT15217.1 type IA DNA topoisomerase [Ammoniphilus sp. CFH 90114]
MKTLVIAEKPSMGRTIAAVMEPRGKNNKTYIEGQDYIITWAIGHLVELAQPEKYDAKFKRWNLNDLPIIPQSFKLVPNFKTRDQLKTIAELSKRCQTLINACDAGREGQLIFYFIQRHLGLKQPVKRLWISDLTPETIRRGFMQLKDETEYANLTKAAKSRSEADWLVGMNGSRAFTTQVKALVSVGRVQTPVLALIYDRQKEMEEFKKANYYEIVAHFRQDDFEYKGKWQGERILDRKFAETIVEKVNLKRGRIAQYEQKETKEYPFKLYDLTLLQREANAKLHFSAKKTLDLAQALYEKHKLISYPRTNSNYVTEENIPEMYRTLESLRGTDYGALANGANKSIVHKNNRSICNPSKVEDHHAILPTSKKPGKLTVDEQKLYDMIVRRFLSQFYPPAEYQVHNVITEVEGERFKTQVKQLLSAGWKVVYPETPKGKKKIEVEQEQEEMVASFPIEPSKPALCQRADCMEKETTPPSLYTEGTLLKAMESAGKRIEDEELRDAMKDSGLGTPATRAATIERLKKVGYIAMEGKKLALTPKGRSTIEWIRQIGIELLTSPEMTGQWERRLNEIAKGQASDTSFLEQVKKLTHLIVEKVRNQPLPNIATESIRQTTAARLPLGTCPRAGCGGQIVEGNKGYGCTHYKTGCTFVIWKNSFGKKISEGMVKTLITKGKTGKLKFKSKTGHQYEAKLVLKSESTGELELEFINNKKAEM